MSYFCLSLYHFVHIIVWKLSFALELQALPQVRYGHQFVLLSSCLQSSGQSTNNHDQKTKICDRDSGQPNPTANPTTQANTSNPASASPRNRNRNHIQATQLFRAHSSRTSAAKPTIQTPIPHPCTAPFACPLMPVLSVLAKPSQPPATQQLELRPRHTRHSHSPRTCGSDLGCDGAADRATMAATQCLVLTSHGDFWRAELIGGERFGNGEKGSLGFVVGGVCLMRPNRCHGRECK